MQKSLTHKTSMEYSEDAVDSLEDVPGLLKITIVNHASLSDPVTLVVYATESSLQATTFAHFVSTTENHPPSHEARFEQHQAGARSFTQLPPTSSPLPPLACLHQTLKYAIEEYLRDGRVFTVPTDFEERRDGASWMEFLFGHGPLVHWDEGCLVNILEPQTVKYSYTFYSPQIGALSCPLPTGYHKSRLVQIHGRVFVLPEMHASLEVTPLMVCHPPIGTSQLLLPVRSRHMNPVDVASNFFFIQDARTAGVTFVVVQMGTNYSAAWTVWYAAWSPIVHGDVVPWKQQFQVVCDEKFDWKFSTKTVPQYWKLTAQAHSPGCYILEHGTEFRTHVPNYSGEERLNSRHGDRSDTIVRLRSTEVVEGFDTPMQLHRQQFWQAPDQWSRWNLSASDRSDTILRVRTTEAQIGVMQHKDGRIRWEEQRYQLPKGMKGKVFLYQGYLVQMPEKLHIGPEEQQALVFRVDGKQAVPEWEPLKIVIDVEERPHALDPNTEITVVGVLFVSTQDQKSQLVGYGVSIIQRHDLVIFNWTMGGIDGEYGTVQVKIGSNLNMADMPLPEEPWCCTVSCLSPNRSICCLASPSGRLWQTAVVDGKLGPLSSLQTPVLPEHQFKSLLPTAFGVVVQTHAAQYAMDLWHNSRPHHWEQLAEPMVDLPDTNAIGTAQCMVPMRPFSSPAMNRTDLVFAATADRVVNANDCRSGEYKGEAYAVVQFAGTEHKDFPMTKEMTEIFSWRPWKEHNTERKSWSVTRDHDLFVSAVLLLSSSFQKFSPAHVLLVRKQINDRGAALRFEVYNMQPVVGLCMPHKFNPDTDDISEGNSSNDKQGGKNKRTKHK
jgi:hypothetical protein